MKLLEVTKILDELINNCPWLKNCLRIMDITEIGDVHEVTEIITENAKINKFLTKTIDNLPKKI